MGQRSSRTNSNTKEEQDDDVKRQVDSDVDNQRPIYQLVDVKTGGGKLVDLIKWRQSHMNSSSRSKDGATNSVELQEIDGHVDEQIRQLVQPLLYNDGRGKLTPLKRIWARRFGIKRDDDEATELEEKAAGQQGQSVDEPHRLVCWRLDERGFVGETALHICFLLSTSSHMLLARKLLRLFPLLINDIYICDEYFGESSLHMAIVNEDIKILKLLLSHGANVHERCLGSFFLPMDQRDKVNHQVKRLLTSTSELTKVNQTQSLDLAANQLSSYKTNYVGYVYWGEYPLSFAISLGLTDCFRLLLAYGADPNRQDSNGNSALHLAVLSNRIHMFDLCFSNGAKLDLVNRLNLTPMTLAAKFGRQEMFQHIIRIQRRVSWTLCQIGFIEIPLHGIDSIGTCDGSCDYNSALSIVVSGDTDEHLKKLDGLLSELLQTKWETSVKSNFYFWFYLFVVFFFTATLAYVTRLRSSLGGGYSHIISRINLASELLVLFLVMYYLWIISTRILYVDSPGAGDSSWQMYRDGFQQTLEQAPELLLFAFTCTLVLACIPLRLSGLRSQEDSLVAVIWFLLPLKLLFFCRASKSLGPFIVMIYKILLNDVFCFVVFLVIFVAGFSQSFFVIFRTHRQAASEFNATAAVRPQPSDAEMHVAPDSKNYFSNLFDGIISMHMMALNEFTMVFDELNSTNYPNLAKLLFLIYMLLVSILLINMLIAMLGKTYQDISSQPNENLRQWARALLTFERMSSKKSRLSMLSRYSQMEDSGAGRLFNSTCALSGAELDEIKYVKLLNEENRRNSAKFNRRNPSSSMDISELAKFT